MKLRKWVCALCRATSAKTGYKKWRFSTVRACYNNLLNQAQFTYYMVAIKQATFYRAAEHWSTGLCEIKELATGPTG